MGVTVQGRPRLRMLHHDRNRVRREPERGPSEGGDIVGEGEGPGQEDDADRRRNNRVSACRLLCPHSEKASMAQSPKLITGSEKPRKQISKKWRLTTVF